MNDSPIFYVTSFLCIVLMFASFKFSKSFAVINFISFCLYNLLLYCNFYKGDGGAVFVWGLSLIVLNIFQILIMSVFILIKSWKK
jgi:hypothetical protein